MQSETSLSIVIPVYNSEKSLPFLLERLDAVLPAITATYEIILVNDGSQDTSWQVIEQLMAQYPAIMAINLMRNFGQHNALLCGIRAARHSVIITMDDDLQNPPENIPALLNKLHEGYDVVYGAPQDDVHGNWLRSLSSWLIRKMLEGDMGADIVRNISSFRAMRTAVRNGFSGYRSSYVSIDVLLTWSTRSFAAVKVDHDHRQFGQSTYSIRKLLLHAINVITGFSTWPLQVASFLGFTFMLFGVGVFLYVMAVYLTIGSLPGFPFLASIISIFSGVQLFVMGVFGEYMLRIFNYTMHRPPYLERHRMQSTASPDYLPHDIHQFDSVEE